MTIQIPAGVLLATGQKREELPREAEFLLAAKLFELGRLSSAKPARLCGMDRVTFLLGLHRAGVPVIDLDE